MQRVGQDHFAFPRFRLARSQTFYRFTGGGDLSVIWLITDGATGCFCNVHGLGVAKLGFLELLTVKLVSNSLLLGCQVSLMVAELGSDLGSEPIDLLLGLRAGWLFEVGPRLTSLNVVSTSQHGSVVDLVEALTLPVGAWCAAFGWGPWWGPSGRRSACSLRDDCKHWTTFVERHWIDAIQHQFAQLELSSTKPVHSSLRRERAMVLAGMFLPRRYMRT